MDTTTAETVMNTMMDMVTVMTNMNQIYRTDEMEFIYLLDNDGSGGISYTEFIQFIDYNIGPMTEEQLAYWTIDAPEIFDDVDADDSGEVEQGEDITS